jgi:hypothetical protein
MRDFRYTSWPYRDSVIAHINSKKAKGKCQKVIDIGASMGGWSAPYVSHYVDINSWGNSDGKHAFIGTLTDYELWSSILDYVRKNGKFDFCICTHTLEDISNPQMVCSMMPKIANGGFVAFPSKFVELGRFSGSPYLGWNHHRWIFNKEEDRLVAYPKLSFLEHKDWSRISRRLEADNWELQFFWKDSFTLHTVNNDFMGPDSGSVETYFNGLFKD